MDITNTLPAGLDPDAKVRCSDWARTAELSPHGTCGSYDGFLLVEIPLPWPRDAGETAEGAAVSALVRPLRYRLQAVVPAHPHTSPRERRVVLHARPPGPGFAGGTAFAGYRRLETTAGDSLPDAVARLTAAAAREAPSEFDSPAVDVLLCSHGTRDSCCGRRGASLAVELADSDKLAGANLWRTSHMGGHRFAPTFLVLPQGTSWGFADLDLVTRVLRQDGDAADAAQRYRGCPGLDRPQVQALEAAVLAEVGWDLLDTPRAGSLDGTHTRLSWSDGARTVSYEAEVTPGRAVPMPGCMTPLPSEAELASVAKRETEWSVTAVGRVLRPAAHFMSRSRKVCLGGLAHFGCGPF